MRRMYKQWFPVSCTKTSYGSYTFDDWPDKKSKKDGELTVPKNNGTLVTQFLFQRSSLDANIDELFQYENQNEPPSIADHFMLRSGKSLIYWSVWVCQHQLAQETFRSFIMPCYDVYRVLNHCIIVFYCRLNINTKELVVFFSCLINTNVLRMYVHCTFRTITLQSEHDWAQIYLCNYFRMFYKYQDIAKDYMLYTLNPFRISSIGRLIFAWALSYLC